MSHLQQLIVPLPTFVATVFEFDDEIRRSTTLESYLALMQLATLLSGLLSRDETWLQDEKYDYFIAPLAKCSVGFIQDVPEQGLNMSFSAGSAAHILHHTQKGTTENEVVLVFEFGAHYTHVSAYSKHNTAIRRWFEITKRDDDDDEDDGCETKIPNPNAVEHGDYRPPPSIKPKKAEQDVKDFAQLILETKAKLVTTLPPGMTVRCATALVTGPLRDHIVKKQEMCLEICDGAINVCKHNIADEALSLYMTCIAQSWPLVEPYGKSPIKFSCALREHDERYFEGKACCMIYNSLSDAKTIKPCSVVCPTMTFGINAERGLCGWYSFVSPEYKLPTIDLLQFDRNKMKKTFYNHLQRVERLDPAYWDIEVEELLSSVSLSQASGKTPILPLMADFALPFTNAKITQQLFASFATAEAMIQRAHKHKRQKCLRDVIVHTVPTVYSQDIPFPSPEL